jgi:hypothetical protein
MAEPLLDIEFSKYWTQLTVSQKQSLLSVIKSFAGEGETLNIEKYNQELADAEAEYESGNYITQEEMLNLISKW